MTKRKYKPWTQADDAELVLMREASTPTTLIAKALKRTHSSVTNRIATLDIPMGKGPNKQRVEMLKAKDHMGRWSLGNFPKIETVQGSQPKPNWWTRIMWWRK
tara:strand:+ start:37 stop:345 length:309 start_codon:yes stop_codon:yes gene_type:complete